MSTESGEAMGVGNCRREQLRIAEWIEANGYDRGAALGLFDAFTEELLIEGHFNGQPIRD